jgi:signal transduction histidine kinase
MWSKLLQWHRDWEAEQLLVLDNPAAAAHVAPGYRRTIARKIAALSPIERMQLRAFSVTFRGWRLYAAIAAFMLLLTGAASVAHVLLPEKPLFSMVLKANLLGVACLICFLITYFNYRSMVGRGWRSLLAAVVFVAVGMTGHVYRAAGEQNLPWLQVLQNRWVEALLWTGSVGLLIAAPLALVGAMRNSQYQVLTAQLERDAARNLAARELSESRLRVLHAQIEPHFLFNTLGAVLQLAERDAPQAAALTASLIAFLRASLDEMRSEQVSLAADFALLDAYLAVMKVRLGARLQHDLHLPADLEAVHVPSMLMLTLVENAIKHGIEPALRGGALQVRAAREADMLRLDVHDSGVGMGQPAGAGHGLDNVRTRLQLLYGARARLVLTDAEGGGVLASIFLPLDQARA